MSIAGHLLLIITFGAVLLPFSRSPLAPVRIMEVPSASELFAGALLSDAPASASAPTFSHALAPRFDPPCDNPGWSPDNFGLKDHHIFWHDGFYYLVSIYIPQQNRLAYGRSADLCNWETLEPVLTIRTPGAWDEAQIWAPFVYVENGVFYMYYTGVMHDFTQSILLATTTTPEDPDSWQEQGMIFQPTHPGARWTPGDWADCRDPSVFKIGNLYYLFYTGRDITGGIFGMATAASPYGPWLDWGSILPLESGVHESITLAQVGRAYYMFYNHVGIPEPGEYYRIGASPGGPWSAPIRLTPGWAHEVWQSPQGDWFISYLTDYSVTISTLTWDSFFDPPHPVMGAQSYHQLLPLIRR